MPTNSGTVSPVGRDWLGLLLGLVGVGRPGGEDVSATGVRLPVAAGGGVATDPCWSPASTQPPAAPMTASSTAATPPPMSIVLRLGAASPLAGCPPLVPSVIPPTASSPATLAAGAKHFP